MILFELLVPVQMHFNKLPNFFRLKIWMPQINLLFLQTKWR